ncbi:MAG: hypothetical protein RI959_1123 [Pseudomonadota bacterium]|jgi:hypothetical protein
MQNTLKLVAAAAALAAASLAHADVSIGANIEHDITKAKGADMASSGRVEVGLGAKATMGDSFVAGRLAVEAGTAGGASPAIADAWVQFGTSSVDLKLGRFEGIGLDAKGKDTYIVGRAAGYHGTTGAVRGRVATGQVHAALGINAAPGLRFELGMVSAQTGQANGFRPVVSYTSGPLSISAGIEMLKNTATGSQTGFGTVLGYDLGGGTSIGATLAKNNDTDASTYGAFANIGALGVGYVHDDNGANVTSNAFYAAYTLPLLDVKGASLTPAISFGKNNGVSDSGVRLRFNYTF